MRFVICTSILFLMISPATHAQILNVAELSVRDIQNLDREDTVVILQGGIFEEHGPYLPSFTDGYMNAYLAKETAEAIFANRGGTVLMFPMIPLGTGLPEDFAGKPPFSGSYTVRPETLRAIYMDLASSIGQDGFRTIFVINRHGAPAHNRALLQAADYFNDRFDGSMVVLTSLVNESPADRPQVFTSDQQTENGFSVHAGPEETSRTLYLKPGLVHDDYRDATPYTANSPDDLAEVAKMSGWPGYFGSPRLADAEKGAQLVKYRTDRIVDLALRVLDGFDWQQLSTRADMDTLPPGFSELDENTIRRSAEERRKQDEWIKKRGITSN